MCMRERLIGGDRERQKGKEGRRNKGKNMSINDEGI